MEKRENEMNKLGKNKIIINVIFIVITAALFLGADDSIVYVTNSGKKYHRETCGSLSRSKIMIPLEDAIRSNYEPCALCNPPKRSTISSAEVSYPAKELYRVNQVNLTKVRDAQTSRMLLVEVVSHIDGDTVRVRIENPPSDLKSVETIRMLGVDTPETVHPTRPVGYFGKEASDFTKERLFGKQVYLAFDWNLRDRYGRLLAYIYTQEGHCFNAVLIQEGYGYTYSSYPFQFRGEFEALEQAAQQEKRGLWSRR
ncbi:MAG: thermonuclease family protein [Spirochaetaceae bacterium]|jgi:micrococcal nuclease|nr:thermonuclease family protein [Spirochaetaceae bacterium]